MFALRNVFVANSFILVSKSVHHFCWLSWLQCITIKKRLMSGCLICTFRKAIVLRTN